MPAIGKHSTATVEKAWDGPANEARLKNDGDAAYYRRAYAWADPEKDPKTKAAYKFVHHEVDGEGNIGSANVVGCTAAIAVLNGGRGGTKIPKDDHQGVWNHVAAHIRAAGKEPAELKRDKDTRDEDTRNEGGLVVAGGKDPLGFEVRCLDPGEVRVKVENGARKLFGYAARFNKWSQDLGGFRERIAPGAFQEAIEEDDVRFTVNHDPNYVLGRNRAKPEPTLVLKEDARGLWFENTPPDTQWARDFLVSVDRGDITQMSFRFQIDKGGEVWDGDERTITKVRPLRDITLATYPAYPDTEAHVRSIIERAGLTPERIFAAFDGHLGLTDEERAAIAETVRLVSAGVLDLNRRQAPGARDKDRGTRDQEQAFVIREFLAEKLAEGWRPETVGWRSSLGNHVPGAAARQVNYRATRREAGGNGTMERELQEKLVALLKEGQAIIDKAREEKRAMTSEEEERLAKLTTDAGKVRQSLEQLRAFAAEQRWAAASPEPAYKPDPNDTEPGSRKDGKDKKRTDGQFEAFGDFVRACRWPDEYRAMEMSVGASGGFLVPPQFRPEILELTPTEAIMRPRAQVIPAGDPPDAPISIPAVDYTQGLQGGVTVVWIAEGGTKAETEGKLVEVTLEPKEVAGHVVVSDKLLRNAASAGPLIRRLLRGAVASAEDVAFIQGNGVGKPKGFINCAGRLDIVRNTAATVKFVDVAAMRKSLIAEAWEAALWIINQSAMDQVMTLQDAVGNSIFLRGDATKNIPDILFGFPIRWTGRCPALGSRGDVNLIDPRMYLIKDGSGPSVAASEHVHFTTNKTVIKIFWNVDGQLWLKAPVTLEDGATQVSAAVVLK